MDGDGLATAPVNAHQFESLLTPFVSKSPLVQYIPLSVMVAGLEAMRVYNPGFCRCHISAVSILLSSTTMSISTADYPDSDILRSVVEHVFMPPKLPQEEPDEQIVRETNVALCHILIETARDFLQDVPASQHVIKMIELAHRAAKFPYEDAELQSIFSNMMIGGMST